MIRGLFKDLVTTHKITHYPMTPRYVTIHNAATKGSAKQIHEYNKLCITDAPDGFKSWHYSVDESEAYQALPDTINVWHAGDNNGPGNRQSIAIEIARDLDYDSNLYQRAEDNAARLAAELLKRYKLGIESLKMHYDWSGKYCPHRILEAGTWEAFRQRVADYMLLPDPLRGGEEVIEKDNNDSETLYRVQLGAFKKRDYAELMAAELKASGYNPIIVTVEVPPCPKKS